MTDLPQIYAEIVARRPELAVPRLFYEKSVMWGSWYRSDVDYAIDVYDPKNSQAFRWLHTDEAEALIGWHWTKMALAKGCGIETNPTNGMCAVYCDHSVWTGPTPLAALAAFWRAHDVR